MPASLLATGHCHGSVFLTVCHLETLCIFHFCFWKTWFEEKLIVCVLKQS